MKMLPKQTFQKKNPHTKLSPPKIRSRIISRINTDENSEEILRKVSSLPIREDQAGMTPEQRKIINEIMDKVFSQMEQEGIKIKPKGETWKTKT